MFSGAGAGLHSVRERCIAFHYIALDSASRSSQLVNSAIGSLVAVIPSSGVAF